MYLGMYFCDFNKSLDWLQSKVPTSYSLFYEIKKKILITHSLTHSLISTLPYTANGLSAICVYGYFLPPSLIHPSSSSPVSHKKKYLPTNLLFLFLLA